MGNRVPTSEPSVRLDDAFRGCQSGTRSVDVNGDAKFDVEDNVILF